MFSGITQGLFPVVDVIQKPGGLSYKIKLSNELISNLKVGASVSVNGVCQTVISIKDSIVSFDAIEETLNKTTIKTLSKDDKASIERSLKFGDEIGGHEVSGHVDGTGIISEIKKTENNYALTIKVPKDWMSYIFSKGFIAIDGSSLTICEINPKGVFTVNLIPETLRLTNFSNKKIGEGVNIELDSKTKVIVKTTCNILQKRQA
jgi:riboflavin synthase